MHERDRAIMIDDYSDSDFGGDLTTRRSTSGRIILLSDNPVIFTSRTQPTIAQSSTEAE